MAATAHRRLLALSLALVILQPRIAVSAARLLEFEGETPAPRLTGADAVAISPDGAFVYVGAGGDEAISIFMAPICT